MEFPEMGIPCAIENCKQNDFLPTLCVHCSGIFCRHHFNVLSHNCTRHVDNIFAEPGNIFNHYVCSQELCNITSPVNMNCSKCQKHFCLSHRHHGCFEKSEQEIAKEWKNWQKPQEEFAAAKNAVDEEINKIFLKSKQAVMVNKLQLMKIKGRAVGSKTIPMDDRRYFFVYPPVQPKVKYHPLAVFVSNFWTVGKVIDTMAESLGLKNSNNIQNAVKLRLFYHDTGELICDQMDALLFDLYRHRQLIDGQSVILEYSNEKHVNCSLY